MSYARLHRAHMRHMSMRSVLSILRLCHRHFHLLRGRGGDGELVLHAAQHGFHRALPFPVLMGPGESPRGFCSTYINMIKWKIP